MPDQLPTPMVQRGAGTTVERWAERLGRAGRWRSNTIWRQLVVVALIALTLGLFVAQRTHLQRWEARRQEMDRQHDVTQAIVFETMRDLTLTDPAEAKRSHGGTDTGKAQTRLWSITLNDAATASDPIGAVRLRVAGANGEFALKPITIEIVDSRLKGPLLPRLSAAYQERGWAFQVIPPE